MLSPLQEQVATVIAGLDEADGFALAGGAALIIRALIIRDEVHQVPQRGPRLGRSDLVQPLHMNHG